MTKEPLGVLIIHGFTSSLDCVRGIREGLAPLDVPATMPVLRGHGADSPEALRGVQWEDWVADAEAALQDLLTEAEKVVVVGHSMGGLVTIWLAADHRDEDVLDSIVLAAPAVLVSSPFAPGRPLAFLAPLVARLLDKYDMPPKYADPSLARYDTNYLWAPMEAIQQFLAFAQAARRRLPEVNVPTRILQSRSDSTVVPKSAEVVYQAIATPPTEKEIIWFERTEHEMFRDCEREAAIQAVVDFVEERRQKELAT
ncbi:MAG: alpha/beta hydrolase [Anaerolineae bacterium]